MGVPFRRFGILIRVMDVLFRPADGCPVSAVSMGVPFRRFGRFDGCPVSPFRWVSRFVPPFRDDGCPVSAPFRPFGMMDVPFRPRFGRFGEYRFGE